MPEWCVQFIQFNGVMTMTVISPDPRRADQKFIVANADEAAAKMKEIWETQQSFEIRKPPWE